MWRTVGLVILVSLLASCADSSGLRAEAKKIPLPEHPRQQWNSNWWEAFHDRQLSDLIATALTHSPDIRIAQARIRLAQRQADISGANLSPTLDVNGSAVREKLSPQGLFPPPLGGSVFNLGQLTLDFNYEFDWWGKNRAALKAAVAEVDASRAEAAEARLILSVAVAQSYFKLQSDAAKTALAQAMLTKQQSLLRLLKLRAHNGVASDLPMAQYASGIATLKLDIARLSELDKLDRNAIAALMGQPPAAGDAIYITSDAAPALPDSIPADLIGSRPDIIAQNLEIKSASAMIDSARADFYPNINLGASVGFQSLGLRRLLQSGSEMATVGPAIHLPIFDAGRLRANLGANYAQYDIAVETYNQTVIGAMRDVNAASVSLRSLKQQTLADQEVVAALKRTRHLAELRYRRGMEDYLAVLQTEIPLLNAQQTRIELDARQFAVTLSLIQALGGLPNIIPVKAVAYGK
ncbi:MAG: efflux transporter outer membrane subunit [Burkholderiales bacterium]